jgi:hypothetical protein
MALSSKQWELEAYYYHFWSGHIFGIKFNYVKKVKNYIVKFNNDVYSIVEFNIDRQRQTCSNAVGFNTPAIHWYLTQRRKAQKLVLRNY